MNSTLSEVLYPHANLAVRAMARAAEKLPRCGTLVRLRGQATACLPRVPAHFPVCLSLMVAGLLQSAALRAEVISQPELEPGVVAKIQDQTLGSDEFRLALERLNPGLRPQLAAIPGKLEEFAAALALRKKLLQDAAREDWITRPDVLGKIRRVEEQELYKAWMRKQAPVTPESIREEEIEQYYQQHPQLFAAPEQITYGKLLIAEKPTASQLQQWAESPAKLAELHQELAATGEESTYEVIGPVPVSALDEETRQTLNGLKIGQLSKPQQRGAGVGLYAIDNYQPAKTRPFAEVSDQVRRAYGLARQEQKERELIEQIRKSHPLTVSNLLLLKRVLTGSATRLTSDKVVGEIGAIRVTTTQIVQLLDLYPDLQPAAADSAALQNLIESELLRRYVLEVAGAGKMPRDEALQRLLRIARDDVVYWEWLNRHAALDRGYPDRAAVLAWYREHIQQFTVPVTLRLRQIFISKASGPELARKVHAMAKAASPQAFGELARQYSDHESGAAKDGELGWVSVTQLQPAVRSHLETAQVGALVGPLETSVGWQIILVEEKKNSRVKKITAVEETIRKLLIHQAREKQIASYLEKEQEKHRLILSTKALVKIRHELQEN